MSQTIGPATKAALARIVSHLPYLKAEGTGIPTATREGITAIKAKYAAIHADSTGDPMITAATEWAEEELAKGLEYDNAGHSKKAKKDEDEDADTHAKKGHK
jgi:hypothetical protein